MMNNNYETTLTRAHHFFWFGFIIYIVSSSFPSTVQLTYSYLITQSLQLLGILFFVLASVFLIEWKFDNSYLRFVFVTYILWLFIVVVRGFRVEYEFIKNLLLDGWFGIFIYLAPLILLFPKNILHFKKITNVIIFLGIVFFIYDLMYYRVLLWSYGTTMRGSTALIETFVQNLALPSGFILFTYLYHNNKKNLFALAVMILTFLLSVIRARRGLMFISVTMLVAAYIIYYFTSKGKVLRVILSVFLFAFLFVYGRQVYYNNRGGVFGLISGRMSEDTRSMVEEQFFSSMKTKDWIIGKGLQGDYYCPGIDEVEGKVTIFRTVIETGYLQIILKGGWVSLGLLILIGIPAIYNGYFKSKNLLSKAAATWILLLLVYTYPSTINTFTLNYLLFWLSVGICYSTEIRDLPDDTVITFFSEK